MKYILVAVFGALVMLTGHAVTAAEGLVPCNQQADFLDAYAAEVDGRMGRPDAGKVIVSFTALPSFFPEWGLQIARDADRYSLRSVHFKDSVWHGAFQEIRPGYFERNPQAALPNPIVRSASLSPRLAIEIQALVTREIARADPANSRSGLDGEDYVLRADAGCGSAYTPEAGSRPGQLVAIFEGLEVEGSLPTPLLKAFWEERVSDQVHYYDDHAPKLVFPYLLISAIGLAVVAIAALPLWVALVVRLCTRGSPKKPRFILISGALSYGLTCLVALPFLPVFLAGKPVSAQLAVDGHRHWEATLDAVGQYAPVVLAGVLVVFSIAVPVLLHRKVLNWMRAAPAGNRSDEQS